MTALRLPTKQEREVKKAVESLLEDGKTAVLIIPSSEGVRIPENLYKHKIVQLHLSKRFAGELLLGQTEIKTTLSFGNTLFDCVIPYNAILMARAVES